MLPIEQVRPETILVRGEEDGYEWIIAHNGKGNRCGYIMIPTDHPWHNCKYQDIDAIVHGGLTYSARGVDPLGIEVDEWWIGFDCAHYYDAYDEDLPVDREWESLIDLYNKIAKEVGNTFPPPPTEEITVKDNRYVRQQCENLCHQAREANASQYLS